MNLDVAVNGTALDPGARIAPDSLTAAGLARLTAWQRLIRRLGGDGQLWEAADPRIICFGGAVEIYPCRHGYLDPDRRWRTGCLVGVRNDRITTVRFRVIDGVYAASNLYERFTDAARERLGEPTENGRRHLGWRLPTAAITADIDRELLNATFELATVGEAWAPPPATI